MEKHNDSRYPKFQRIFPFRILSSTYHKCTLLLICYYGDYYLKKVLASVRLKIGFFESLVPLVSTSISIYNKLFVEDKQKRLFCHFGVSKDEFFKKKQVTKERHSSFGKDKRSVGEDLFYS